VELSLDSVNLSWVACWADALDLQPSIECTWVGRFFFTSINRVQFVAKNSVQQVVQLQMP
jgi:hypothetical protein